MTYSETKIVSDNERYGMRTELFGSLADVQQQLRDMGPEFAGVTLDIQGGNAIYDERQECIGRIVDVDD